MAYDVLVFALTDSQMMNLLMGPELLPVKREELKTRLKPYGFVDDLPIQTHTLTEHKLQVWTQRMTSQVMLERITQIAIKCDEDAVDPDRVLHCPHGEPTDDVTPYLGFEIKFCHDCMMIFAEELLEVQRSYFDGLSTSDKHRHWELESQRVRWLVTRKINWIHCGGTDVTMEPYKKQLGF